MRRPDEASLITREFVDAFVATARDIAEMAMFSLMALGAVGIVVGAVAFVFFIIREIRGD